MTFAEQVNEVTNAMTQGEDGKWVLPEGEHSPELKYAAVSEKRRRDAQSALGKTQHSLQATELERDALKTRLTSKAQITISAEEQEELDELKFKDPESWRTKMNELEQRATEQTQTELAEVSNSVTQEAELIRRKQVLAEFETEHPGFQIDDDVIANDIPPRITNKLANDEVTFEQFLQEAYTYLSKDKVIVNEEVNEEPDLNNIGGSHTPSKTAQAKDMTTSYDNEIY